MLDQERTEYVLVEHNYQMGVEPFTDTTPQNINGTIVSKKDANNAWIDLQNRVVGENGQPIVNSINIAQGPTYIIPSEFSNLDWRPFKRVYGPSINHGHQQWGEPTFTVEPELVTATFLAVDRPVSERKNEIISYLASLRWSKETNGFYYRGNWYPMGRETRNTLLNTIWVEGLSWKTKNNSFVSLTQENFNELKEKINTYVQGCFSKEAYYLELITNAADHDALDAIFIEADWPLDYYPDAPPPPVVPDSIKKPN